MHTTRSLAQALGRTNCLVVGAGQTPTRTPHTRLLTCTLPLWLASSLTCFHPLLARFSRFLLSPLTSLASERTSNSFYIAGRLGGRRVFPKLTPPHLRTVTMTTRALSKKVGVGARERTLLRKNKGVRQSSRKIASEEEWERASELVKEMCVNVTVMKKKSFPLETESILYPSQRITFKIPLDMGMGLIRTYIEGNNCLRTWMCGCIHQTGF